MKKLNNYINENFRLRDDTKIKESEDVILSNMAFIEEGETISDYFEECKLNTVERKIDKFVCDFLNSDTMRLTRDEWKTYDTMIHELQKCDIYNCEEDTSVWDIAQTQQLPKTWVVNEYKFTISYYKSKSCVVIEIFNGYTDDIQYFFAVND